MLKITIPSSCICFFFCCILFLPVKAQDTIQTPVYDSLPIEKPEKFAFKFYPGPLIASQFPYYCSEIAFGGEYQIAKHQGLQLKLGGFLPSPLGAIGQAIAATLDASPIWLFGVKGGFAYRYYLKKYKEGGLRGLYVGAEVSFTGVVSLKYKEYYRGGNNRDINWTSPPARSHFFISKYCIAIGYQYTAYRKKSKRNLLIDIGTNLGYQYARFWRHYDGYGNVAYQKKGEYYWYYQKIPATGTVYLALGGLF